MELVVTYLAVVFGCGLLARLVRLPALIGFLGAGFLLNTLGIPKISGLDLMSDIGVTLMLFAIGLRLDVRTLLRREVWISAALHMLIMTVLGTLALLAMSLLGAFGPEPLRVLAVIALVLSFSSTILVLKILQDRGDEQSLYGNICIGVLIMQDIAAVAVISVSTGEPPSPWSLGLLGLVPLLAIVTRRFYLLGQGDLGALFGVAMAMIPGYALFSWLGISGSLGALVMGLVLARHPGAEQLSGTLFTLKELLLVGFFVSIGFHGMPTLANVGVGLLLLLLLPLQAIVYWVLLWMLGLRNRTSVLAALLLSNFSEFALIVAAIGVEDGWLATHWLESLVVTMTAGFVISSVVNPQSVSATARLAQLLPARPPDRIHPDDRPLELGDAKALVLGMGRVGRMTYLQLEEEHGYAVLGVEHDPSRVQTLQDSGFRVVEGDATDHDFWVRVGQNDTIAIIALAMPSQHANVEALRQLREVGVGRTDRTIAAIALHREDIGELESLGIDTVVHLYAGAGESLADRAAEARTITRRRLRPDDPAKPPTTSPPSSAPPASSRFRKESPRYPRSRKSTPSEPQTSAGPQSTDPQPTTDPQPPMDPQPPTPPATAP